MLRIMEAAEFDRYIELAYELAMDPARSGYPTYCDGCSLLPNPVKITSPASSPVPVMKRCQSAIAFRIRSQFQYISPWTLR